MTLRLKTIVALVATVGSLLAGSALYAQQKAISIVTGGTGGVYYPLGGAMANVLSKYLPGIQATAEVTGGSVDNLKLIGTNKAEIGLSMMDAALDALNGVDKFSAGKIPARTLMVLYPNRMHVVTIEATGINTMADLRGKRVSTGSPGSATEVMAFRVLEAAGYDVAFFRDLRRERLGVAESVNALKDRKIDAFFWVGGIPTAAVTDLGATPGVKIKLLDTADLVATMNKKYNDLYSTGVIKAGAYPGQAKDNAVSVVWNILVASATMSDDMAYNIVKTLMEKNAELVAEHREAANFTLENQVPANSAIPWHPGATRYFKERGVKM